jgi:hypothetical protein
MPCVSDPAVASGRSVFRLVGSEILPVPLTRKMCHLLVNPGRPLSIAEAVRRAQVLAHGGNPRLVPALGQECWVTLGSLPQEEFRAEVVHWLCRQNEVDLTALPGICEYLLARHEDDANFKMKGRTWISVARATKAWQKHQIELLKVLEQRDFEPSGFKARHWKSRRRENGVEMPPDVWVMREILKPVDMVNEGKRMNHYVGGYHDQVREGKCSIWSLALNGQGKLTVEVYNKSREVGQFRGRYNRDPRPHEARLVKTWAVKNHLNFTWLGERILERVLTG